MIRCLLFTAGCFFSCCAAFGQAPSELLAEKIAARLKDSLQLTVSQKNAIYQVNLDLHQQKLAARELHPGDSLTHHIQQIENSRDSLYRPILGEEKYPLYRSNKRRLVSND